MNIDRDFGQSQYHESEKNKVARAAQKLIKEHERNHFKAFSVAYEQSINAILPVLENDFWGSIATYIQNEAMKKDPEINFYKNLANEKKSQK